MATITVAMETSKNGFRGDQNPKANNTYNLGSEDLKWRTLFADSLYINGEVVNVSDLAYRGNPKGEPLLTSGGAMSGPIGFKPNQFAIHEDGTTQKEYAIDLKNSDIIGANAIVFADESQSIVEGICFPKTGKGGSTLSQDYDTIRAKDGVLYFNSQTIYTSGNRPSAPDMGALERGDWSIDGQNLRVHGKRALVGTREGVIHLGYGSDFNEFKCGSNTIWHTGNLNENVTLNVGSLSSTQEYITIGGRRLYVSSSQPASVPDGTIWIK